MNDLNDLHGLIGGYLDGQLSADQLDKLSERLRADDEAVETFVEVAAADVLVEQYFHNAGIDAVAARWLKSLRHGGTKRDQVSAHCSDCVETRDIAVPSLAADDAPSRGFRFFLAVSVSFLLVAAAVLAAWSTWRQDAAAPPRPQLATLLSTQRVEWPDGASMTVGEQFSPGESIRIASGLVELGLEAGGELILKGPAELEFVSPLKAILHRGTVTAKIEQSAQGFRVDTPNANVVDLGTEFGVAVSERGETDVVVFSGRVEMQIPDGVFATNRKNTAQVSLAASRLLLSGDGLRVGSKGGVSRLVAINSSEYPTSVTGLVETAPISVIDSVSDNLREDDTTKCYRIVPHGLTEDTVAYVDRDHQWNGVDGDGIPEFLIGADYVMPFNDDKLVDRLEVRISFSAPARLYVFIDERVPTPNWIAQDKRFLNTRRKIGLDEGDFPNALKKTDTGAGESIDNVCNIWMMEVRDGGPVTLGSLGVSEEFTSMYGIAATPLRAAP